MDTNFSLVDLPQDVAALITRDPRTGCWIWGGRKQVGGYGVIHREKRKQLTHRLVYTLLVGPIPDGHVLDHVYERGCRSRACCWPGHLEPVTVAENNRRGRQAPHVVAEFHGIGRAELPTIFDLARIVV